MAFIRATVPDHAPPPLPLAELLELLAADDASARRRAARDLGGVLEAAATVARCLAAETDRGVREALLGSLVATGGAAVALLVAPFLRSPEAALRNGALEALKQLGVEASAAAVDALLEDAAADVRLLAIEVTRAWPSQQAEPRLCRIFEADAAVNVCAAAVDVATEVGTAALLPPLARLRARFGGETFLIFAVDLACSRISGTPPPVAGPR